MVVFNILFEITFTFHLLGTYIQGPILQKAKDFSLWTIQVA